MMVACLSDLGFKSSSSLLSLTALSINLIRAHLKRVVKVKGILLNYPKHTSQTGLKGTYYHILKHTSTLAPRLAPYVQVREFPTISQHAISRDVTASQFECSMAEVKLNFEGLKSDVSAIQFCISELLPTLGQLHSSSWRFPEISSSEVNTKKLLDKIAFTENEEKFANARTLLLELTIDR